MTPMQVRFCHYVVHGNVKQARAVLLEMKDGDDIFAQDDNGNDPAKFSLWAAGHPDPKYAAIEQLKALYRHIPLPEDVEPTVRSTPEEAVCEVLIPRIQASLLTFLRDNFARHVAPYGVYNAEQQFNIVSCTKALQFMLDHQTFENVSQGAKDLMKEILKHLEPHAETDAFSYVNVADSKQQPRSIKNVLAELYMPDMPDDPAISLQPSATFLASYPGYTPRPSTDGNKENTDPTPTQKVKARGYFPSSGNGSGYHKSPSHSPIANQSKPETPHTVLRFLDAPDPSPTPRAIPRGPGRMH